MLPDDGLALAVCEQGEALVNRKKNKPNQWTEFPELCVSEILMATELKEGKVRVKGTIFANDTDYAWYYFNHAKCNKKVIKIKSAVQKDLFRCDECKDNITNVSSKFKLHLMVKDETAEIKFMLLDSVAEKLIGISAETLLDGSLDEMEDPTILPDPIKDLVGKAFQFGVLVNKDNVFWGNEIYKVGKTWSIDEVLKIEEGSEPLNPLDSAISSEQVSLIDINSQENPDACLTPLSKPKTLGDLADINSATKEKCFKTIKIEKIDD